jgi:hypothetical protein
MVFWKGYNISKLNNKNILYQTKPLFSYVIFRLILVLLIAFLLTRIADATIFIIILSGLILLIFFNVKANIIEITGGQFNICNLNWIGKKTTKASYIKNEIAHLFCVEGKWYVSFSSLTLFKIGKHNNKIKLTLRNGSVKEFRIDSKIEDINNAISIFQDR